MDFIKVQTRQLTDRKKNFLVLLFFIFVTICIFKSYFLKNQVPFPANLLVAYNQPWLTYGVPDYPSGPPNKPIGFDNLRIFYPLRKITIEQIKSGEIPLWNPYSFSGNTHIATYQTAVFHPLSFLFLILPQIDAWSIIIILSPIFALFFTYLFLKELGLSVKASVFGSIVFGLSSFSVVWWEESIMSYYSALFLPLVLFSIERLFNNKGKFNFLILTLALSASILSGWFQMSFYLYVLSFAYASLLTFKTKNYKTFLIVCVGYFFSILISAVHLIPSFESLKYAPRGTTDAKYLFDGYLLNLKDLATVLIPDIFGNPGVYNYFGTGFYYEKVMFIGIPGLTLALYEFFTHSTSIRERFFKASFIICFSLGFALPTTWFLLYSLDLPLISKIIPSRIFYLSTFSLSILSAYGMERYFYKFSLRKTLISVACLAVAFYVVRNLIFDQETNFFQIFPKDVSVAVKSFTLQLGVFVLSSIILLTGLIKRLRIVVFFAILFLSIASSFYLANKYLYFSERRFVYPSTPLISKIKEISGINRVVSVGNGYIDRNILSYYGILSTEGYDSIYIGRYGELIHSISTKGKYTSNIPRADAKIVFIDNVDSYESNFHRSRILDLLGVKFVLSTNKDTDTGKSSLVKIWTDGKYSIYSSKKALPRFFLVKDHLVVKESQEILDKIYDPKINLSETVILEESPNMNGKVFSKGEVKLVSYKPNNVSLETNTDGIAILFLSDNYFPGWKAFVNGKETKIYRANYSFRAVVLTPGDNKINFVYNPISFKVGVFISLVSSVFLIIIAFLINKQLKFMRSKKLK